jgi:hypothetical protein
MAAPNPTSIDELTMALAPASLSSIVAVFIDAMSKQVKSPEISHHITSLRTAPPISAKFVQSK